MLFSVEVISGISEQVREEFRGVQAFLCPWNYSVLIAGYPVRYTENPALLLFFPLAGGVGSTLTAYPEREYLREKPLAPHSVSFLQEATMALAEQSPQDLQGHSRGGGAGSPSPRTGGNIRRRPGAWPRDRGLGPPERRQESGVRGWLRRKPVMTKMADGQHYSCGGLAMSFSWGWLAQRALELCVGVTGGGGSGS